MKDIKQDFVMIPKEEYSLICQFISASVHLFSKSETMITMADKIQKKVAGNDIYMSLSP